MSKTRTTFSLIFVFSLTLGSPSSTVYQRLAYKACMKTGRRSEDSSNHHELTEHCSKTLVPKRKDVIGFEQKRLIYQRNMAWTSQRLESQYFRSLNKWKNGIEELGPALLERVSTCWRRSKSLEDKWMSFYEKRKGGEFIMLKPKTQKWSREEGIASIAPLPNSVRTLVGEIYAGELVLYRHTSSSIGENFGRYRTAVYHMNGNATGRVHSDSQASCASKQGDLMVLDVDVSDIGKNWINTKAPLDLRVRVMTRRQYFNTKKSITKIPVVKQIVGLALHYLSNEETLSSHLVESVKINDARMKARHAWDNILSVGMRKKRSTAKMYPGRKRRASQAHMSKECKRTHYQLSQNLYESMNIQYPEHHHEMLDIGECVGTCPHPISSVTLNATNHAIAISSDARNHPSLTICCVPITYKSIYYDWLHPDENYTLQRRMKNFVATSCACR